MAPSKSSWYALLVLSGTLADVVKADAPVGSVERFGDTETQAASEVLIPALLPLYGTLDPDNTGGAMLLGVDGLCLISHGSSSATAIVNAIRVAQELHDAEIVDSLRVAIS